MNPTNDAATNAKLKKIEPFTDFIQRVVAPERRSAIKINPDHKTFLTKTKTTKKQWRKKCSKKSKTLTRKEYANLGLYKLPKQGMKYDEFRPLHDLWKGYIAEHLSLDADDPKVPAVHEPGYEAFSKLLMKSDLHGAIITVCKSKCPNFVGQTGIVVLESKNMLQIIGKDNKLRSLPKSESIFKIVFGSIEFTILGKYATIRPAEKSVKKIKTIINLDL